MSLPFVRPTDESIMMWFRTDLPLALRASTGRRRLLSQPGGEQSSSLNT
jgi:hypothetical protein